MEVPHGKDFGASGDNPIVEGADLSVLQYPKRFDIIVFPYKYEEKYIFYRKRIIGLPGETIQVTARHDLDIKRGKCLTESYGREVLKSGGIAEIGESLWERMSTL